MDNENTISEEEIKNQIISLFLQLGKDLGLTDSIIQEKTCMTSVYLVKTHALELQIDWFDNSLFVYVVRLINKQIPNRNIIYSYSDGSWCRKIIEDVINTNDNKLRKKRIKNRHSRLFMLELLNYYIDLLEKNSSDILGILEADEMTDVLSISSTDRTKEDSPVFSTETPE